MEGKEKEEAKRRTMMKIKLKETDQEINHEDIKRQEAYNMSPRARRDGGGSVVVMGKSSSVRQNCLCAPTTHPGSFRCRYHRRNAGLGMSRGISVPTNLSMLAGAGGSNSTSPKTSHG
ncbi:unnamed protein product [Cochlearia groenlandica]